MNILTDGRFDKAVVRAVAAYTGEAFQITGIRENTASAMHDAAFFEGTLGLLKTPFCVFVKAGTNPFSEEQFRAEARGLDYIREHTPVKAPRVIGVEYEGNTALLILEVIEAKKPASKADWEKMGQGLAALHRVTADTCGFDFSTYLGIFRQDNTRKKTWREFFGECRLQDTMKIGLAWGKLNADDCRLIERLIARLPAICPEPSCFSLLHGDPWVGNLLFDGNELVLIDCSLYYGNREIDLTTVDFFCPVPQYFFDAYRECFPIEAGFEERADLWEINQWIGHVILYGDRYRPKLAEAAAKYVDGTLDVPRERIS